MKQYDFQELIQTLSNHPKWNAMIQSIKDDDDFSIQKYSSTEQLSQNQSLGNNQSFLSAGIENSHKPTHAEIWGIGLLVVTIINASACLGIVFIPLMKRNVYKLVMSFMVALAVGCLAGSALLVLLPEALGLKKAAEISHDKVYVWKCTTALAGVYAFFLLERLLKTVLEKGCCATDDTETEVDEDVNLNICHNHQPIRNHPSPDNTMSEQTKLKVAPVAWMIILGDSVHNFVDGLSLGATFSQDITLGLSMALAIICEELPHELGDFAVLLNSGMSMRKALCANSLSALSCYGGFIIGALLGEWPNLSSWIIAFASGMFLYISLVDMMPEVIQMYESKEAEKIGRWKVFIVQNLGLLTGYSFLIIITMFDRTQKPQ